MTEALVVLQVVVPLLSAPVCLLLGQGRLVRPLALAVTAASAVIAVILLWQVKDGAVLSYEIGNWAPPWGIEYRVDRLNALVLVVVTAVALAALTVGTREADKDVRETGVHLLAAAYLLCMTGLAGMAITGDLFNVFVFLEISSLASYTLVSMGHHRRALTAAFTYLVMGTIGGTFILIGIGLVYQVTGSLNMADIAARLSAVRDHRSVPSAFAFLTVGTAIKLAVFPLNQWLPNAYAYAPSAVSAFLSGTATKVIYYLLIRVIFTLFGAKYVFDTLRFGDWMVPFSIAAMFVGSLAAVYQNSVKRLLAYSSIAQIGYLTLALSLGTAAALVAGLIHLVNHALMKSGLFLAVSCFSSRTGSDRLDSLAGMGRRMPITSGAFVVGGLGLIGVPATVGFVSKWYLVLAALEMNSPLLAAAILASSLIAAIYVWRVVEVVYFRRPESSEPGVREAPLGMLVPTCVVIGATIYFGLVSELPVRIATGAAEQLFLETPR